MTSPLATYHNQIVRALGADENVPEGADPEQSLHYDVCDDLAIELLAHAGYSPESPDDLDRPVSEDVQTLLTLAMFRAPQLRELITEMLGDLS